MVKIWNVTIPELSGDEERRVYIYLPASYNKIPDRYYPVLYMFDGHNLFFDSHATYGKSWGLKKYLQRSRLQLIVVGVECNHGANGERLEEYAPYDFSAREFGGTLEGRGHTTMEWFVNELKPCIDETFRTISDRDHTFIAGSSMGGLMSFYALFAYNHIFSRAAALSPSLWANTPKLKELVKESEINPETYLYLDYGSNEIRSHRGMAKIIRDLTTMVLRKKIYLTHRVVPHGDHSEASWEKQLPFVMESLFYDLYW